MDSTTNNNNNTSRKNNGPDTWVCPFGKYRDHTYKSICLEDPDYAKWLITVLRSQAAKNYMMSLL